MTYICHKCNVPFSTNGSLQRHNNKKNPCNVDEKKIIKENKRKCPDCDKSFCSNQTLVYHMDGRCKIKNDKNINIQPTNETSNKQLLQEDNLLMILKLLQKKDEDIEILKKENNQLKKSKTDKPSVVNGDLNNIQSTDTINSSIINVQNIHNEIHQNDQNDQNNVVKLIAYGKEDLSYISDDNYKFLFNKGYNSVPHFIEYIHFNKNKPENQNIYISNMTNKYVLIYDGEKWILKCRDDILREMIEIKTDILNEKFISLIKTLDENTIKKFNCYLDDHYEDIIIEQIMKNIKLILYNRKQIEPKA